MNLRSRAAIIASLMMSGVGPTPTACEPQTEPLQPRSPIPSPYFPSAKREPPPLTPEQIKAQEKRVRKAAKRKGTTS